MIRFLSILLVSMAFPCSISAQLVAEFVLATPAQTQVCTGTSVGFTDKSEGSLTSWKWDFGDGNQSSEQHPIHTYQEPGTYSVTLTVGNGTAFESATQRDVLVVVPAPQAAIGASTTRDRVPFDVEFTNFSTNANRFTWLLPGGETTSELNASMTFEEAGTYQIHLIARNDLGCRHTSTIVVQAEPTVCESFCLETVQNPSRSFIEFRYRLGPKQESGEIRLFSASGQQLQTVAISGHQGMETLDVRGLKPGIYYFGLASGDRSSELQPVAIMP
ncbi:MAG: PKD domain-containing protein [Salibacteraceae bacterium]